MNAHPPRMDPAARLDAVEGFLADLLHDLPPTPTRPRGPGAPPVLPAFVLWCGLLVCVLRGFSAQRSLWQLLTFHGLWHFPRVDVTSQALYQRLARTPPTPLLHLLEQVTALLRERYHAVCDVPCARFATEIFALDHSTLDAVLRKGKLLRDLPRGATELLPGQLATLFDLRRQFFARVEFWEDPEKNEKADVLHWLTHLPAGSLLLCDLGFFSFRWFDTLTAQGYYFVSRLREKTTFVVQHTFYAGVAGPVHLVDQLVYLGAYRADRAAHPVRLLVITHRGQTWRYLTNVLDPQALSAADVVALYRRRWDIEQAFHLLKTHLNLFLLWSGHPHVVQQQVFATLIIAQVVLALRTEVAVAAQAPLREVSLPLLLRWLPSLAAQGEDPIVAMATRGRRAKIIRPFRGREYALPVVSLDSYAWPPERPPPRKARYAAKHRGAVKQGVPHTHRRQKRGWGVRRRRPRRR